MRRGECADGYEKGEGKYFLEGKKELLDGPTEWHYDHDSKTLRLKPRDAAALRDVRRKVSTYAFEVTDSSYVHFRGLKFFATALRAYEPLDTYGTECPTTIHDNKVNKCMTLHHLTFEDLTFDFPDANMRPLRKPLEPFRSNEVYTEKNPEYPTDHTFINNVFRYADGSALRFKGGGARWNNNLWEWNSWTSLPAAEPGPMDEANQATLLLVGSEPPKAGGTDYFQRNTFRFNGNTKGMRPGGGYDIVDSLFQSQLNVAKDGAMVQAGGDSGVKITGNWFSNSGKPGLRFDGSTLTGTAKAHVGNNTAWNLQGFSLKGEDHEIFHNTVLLSPDVSAKGPVSLPLWDTEGDWASCGDCRGNGNKKYEALAMCRAKSFLSENTGGGSALGGTLSRIHHNLFDRVVSWRDCNKWLCTSKGKKDNTLPSCPNVDTRPDEDPCPFSGTWDKNVFSSWEPGGTEKPYRPLPNKVKQQLIEVPISKMLRDVKNYDFRPCPGTPAANSEAAGSYPVFDPSQTTYHIPGAREATVSSPSPRLDNDAPKDAALFFRPAYKASKHTLYLSESEDGSCAPLELENVQDLPCMADGVCANLVHSGALRLKPNRLYFWRVDALVDGVVVTGPRWHFRTTASLACSAFEPPQVHVIPDQCKAALTEICGDKIALGERPCRECYERAKKSMRPDILIRDFGCTEEDFVHFCPNSCGPLKPRITDQTRRFPTEFPFKPPTYVWAAPDAFQFPTCGATLS